MSHHLDKPKSPEIELMRLSLRGRPDEEWDRLFASISGAITAIAKKITESDKVDSSLVDEGRQFTQDITRIAASWAKAKVEKPSLENEKLRAEIAVSYANTKKVFTEIDKMEEERRGLQLDNRHKEIAYLLDDLERLLRLEEILKGVHLSYTQTDDDGFLLLGPKPSDLDLPRDRQKELPGGKNIGPESADDDPTE